MKSPSSTLVFGCYPDKYTCDIFRRFGFWHITRILIKNEEVILRYINKVKYIYDIGLPTTGKRLSKRLRVKRYPLGPRFLLQKELIMGYLVKLIIK